MEYLGHTVNFKTEKVSYKSRKVKQKSPDEWVIFENTQEPIIDENTFMIVRNLRRGRVRRTSLGESPLFSGLLFCADCGKKMNFQRKQGTPAGKERFFCSAYLQYRECTAHYLRLDALEEVILQNLREAIAYVARYESDFIREASDANEKERDRKLAKVKDELRKAESRIAELDNIIKHLYEDNIGGKLTDDRFVKLSRDYELEQDDLKSSVECKRRELKEREKNSVNVKSFIDTAKKYTNLKKLDATVLREFISKIYVSERDKETKTREIRIVYNFVGAFDFDSAVEQTNNPRIAEKAG
jgi:hypothetical protein